MEKIKVRKDIWRFSMADVVEALREKFGLDLPDDAEVKQVRVKESGEPPSYLHLKGRGGKNVTMFEVKVVDVEED